MKGIPVARDKAVIYRVNCSNYGKRFEQWADQPVAIFATVGESSRLRKGCGNKVSRKGKFGLRHERSQAIAMSDTDKLFAGSIPELYDTYLVPLIFEPYAADLARRVAAVRPRRVLEIAAGTGVATRAMSLALPADVSLVATDLNQPMLDRAAAVGTARPGSWRQADALQFAVVDASFDVVVCQFGVMFFPDKPKAFAEARRVLGTGGTLLFNVWDRIEENEFADRVTIALGGLFPGDPPRFMARTPHGYHDLSTIVE